MQDSLISVKTSRVLLCILCYACDASPPRNPAIVERVGEPPANGSIDLEVNSNVPLEPSHLVRLGKTSYVFADRLSPTLWLARPLAKAKSITRETMVDPSGQARIVDMSYSSGLLGVLTQRGEVIELQPESWSVTRTHAFPLDRAIKPLALHGLPDSSWLVLAEEMRGERATSERRTLLSLWRFGGESDSARLIWEREKWNRATLGSAALDRSSMTGAGDTITIAGTFPPRVIRYVVDSGFQDSVRLSGVPERLASEKEIRMQEAAMRALPKAIRDRLPAPDTYPAVLRAWTVGEGQLVLAANESKSVALDWYCRGGYQKTVFSGLDIRGVSLASGAVAVVREVLEQGRYTLEFYSIPQLKLHCT